MESCPILVRIEPTATQIEPPRLTRVLEHARMCAHVNIGDIGVCVLVSISISLSKSLCSEL